MGEKKEMDSKRDHEGGKGREHKRKRIKLKVRERTENEP